MASNANASNEANNGLNSDANNASNSDANNASNSGSNSEANSGASAGNASPNFFFPGSIYPYELAQDVTEDPFEPISLFSVQESGRNGPLNEEKLKKFIRHKFDRRVERNTRANICEYTTDIQGLFAQLNRLKERMSQIRRNEKELTNKLKKRIKEIETALGDRKKMPTDVYYFIDFSNVAKAAFVHIGENGPLNEDSLKRLIRNGNTDIPAPDQDIIKQLKALRLRIIDNVDIQKHKYELPYQRILKAIDDILRDMMTVG